LHGANVGKNFVGKIRTGRNWYRSEEVAGIFLVDIYATREAVIFEAKI